MNRYPAWKYILIVILVVTGLIYAMPNLYGDDPALQITSSRGAEISEVTKLEVEIALEEEKINPVAIELGKNNLLVKFADEETQLRAQDVLKKSLGRTYVVALNLAPATPEWLKKLGADPMFLGLDLRGGVHLLIEVDMDAAIQKAEDSFMEDFRSTFRENKIRYKTISRHQQDGILIRFRDANEKLNGIKLIEDEYRDLEVIDVDAETGEFQLITRLSEALILETKKNALSQNLTTFRKRVNELGVAEPVVQQQGTNRIVVQLPGIQDSSEAIRILSATATLEFRLVDDTGSIQDALDGRPPVGSKLYYERNGQPILLVKRVILTGDRIINAASGIDPQSGGPDVTITLDGKGAKKMQHGTQDNVGKRMGVVFIETKTETIEKNGEKIKQKEIIEEVINAATIRETLGKRFHITGLDSTQEARDLALLLRAGALAAPIEIIEERTVGPSLGKDNIAQGFESVMIGFALVLVFMALNYKVFGLIADIALALNLVLIIALLSMLQATLTLPGIAGIVLTVGMAVDANVLIFERIREEIRNKNSPHASIHAGYEKALSTIADANITTLIAALVLFSFGTGPIKGFAVTLSLGIICSMFTAIMVSRSLVNIIYGGRKLKTLTI